MDGGECVSRSYRLLSGSTTYRCKKKFDFKRELGKLYQGQQRQKCFQWRKDKKSDKLFRLSDCRGRLGGWDENL